MRSDSTKTSYVKIKSKILNAHACSYNTLKDIIAVYNTKRLDKTYLITRDLINKLCISNRKPFNYLKKVIQIYTSTKSPQ